MGGETLGALGVLACGLGSLALALLVRRRRPGGAGAPLTLALVGVALWNLAYAAELVATDPQWRLAAGDLKYLGICLLTPGWLLFILRWTGWRQRAGRRLQVALAVEPLVFLLLLALPATHDLVRYLPADDPLHGEIATGPVFWVNAAYSQLLLLPATGVLVVSLLRRSRAYWLQAAALSATAVLPWAANLLFILSVGPFGRFDLTPVAFALTGAVLAWGVFSQRLLRLTPLARSLLVDRMPDGVVVLDVYGHVADVNPAARAVLGHGRGLIGRPAEELLPPQVLRGGDAEVVLDGHAYEVSDVPLPGRRGQPAGRLLVLRDVTERSRLEQRLRELLAEQARVAEQLSSSLRPARLPAIAGLQLAACFRPAGSGTEIGGDFYDVHAVGDEWAFTLGDVSGKGAQAAATTANARYTLRTLVLAGARPAAALEQLHERVVADLDDETYLTVVHGRVTPRPDGTTSVVLALGGHPQPLVVRADGSVEPVGVPGSAIGLLDTVSVRESEVLLADGDALFLYTDGISEARAGDALFAEQGLEQVLARCAGSRATYVVDAVLSEVLGLRTDEPADDIAMLVLRCGQGVPAGDRVDDGAGARTAP